MELLKKALDLTNKNLVILVPPIVFGLIVMFLMLPIGFFGGLSLERSAVNGNGLPVVFLVGIIVLWIIFMLGNLFVYAGKMGMIAEAVHHGQTTIKHFFSFGRRYFLKMLALGVVLTLLGLPLFGIVIFSAMTLNDASYTFYILMMVILFICVPIYQVVAMFSLCAMFYDDTPVIATVIKGLKVAFSGFFEGLKVALLFIFVGLPIYIIIAIISNFIIFIGPIFMLLVQVYIGLFLLIWMMLFYEKYHD